VFASRAARLAAESRAHFLLGVIEWRRKSATEFEGFNSAVMLDPDGVRSFEYDKVHLVPFGEYVPLRRVLPMLESLVAEVGDFSAGTERNVGTLRLLSAGQRRPAATRKFGVFICYEAIFPDEVRQFTRNGAELLVNLSNDGWFGPTAARDQHLAMARVRAIENRRWLLRATNTGHTVAVDPYGRITARLAPDKRAALEAWFDFRADMTLYARWGDWFAWVCAGLSALMLALHWMESRRSAGAAAGG
jgi:apolipoprotein N-acyltransferase